MHDSKLTEIQELIDEAICASSKKEALPFLTRLKSLSLGMKDIIDSYHFVKLNEVIAYTEQASGKVKEKEHWVSCM